MFFYPSHLQYASHNRSTEVGIYKRKQESKKTRKHAFDQEGEQEKKKKTLIRPRKR